MENKNLKNSQITKVVKEKLSRTFEGALFSDAHWFLSHGEYKFSPLDATSSEVIDQDQKIVVKNSPVNKESLIKVLFVGDTYSGDGDDLLLRMIQAMKLTSAEFKRILLDNELEEVSNLEENLKNPNIATSNLFKTIEESRPEVVVALGATVTNILLGRREKLSTIHGQFFNLRHKDWSFSLLAIFHPEYLKINPNMKKTAWTDLQKVMKRVGKI